MGVLTRRTEFLAAYYPPPTIRSTASDVDVAPAGTTFTVTRPTTYNAGDTIMVWAYVRASAGTVTDVTIPSFTARNQADSIAEVVNTGAGGNRYWFLLDKVATGSEAASYTMTVTGTGLTIGWEATGQMVLSACTYNDAAFNGEADNAVTTDAITQAAAGGLVIAGLYGVPDNPAGYTSRLLVDSNDLRLTTVTQASAGAVSAVNATSASAGFILTGHVVYTTEVP